MVAGIYETIGNRRCVSVVVVFPPCPVGKDDIFVVQFYGVAAILLGDQDFVELLSGADADGVDLAVGGDEICQVDNFHRLDFWDEDFAADHDVDAIDDEIDGCGQGDPESGHAFVGQGDFAGGGLFYEQGYDAAAAADDVSVADYAEDGFSGTCPGISVDEDFFGAKFGGAVEVYRVDCFVGADAHDFLDAGV